MPSDPIVLSVAEFCELRGIDEGAFPITVEVRDQLAEILRSAPGPQIDALFKAAVTVIVGRKPYADPRCGRESVTQPSPPPGWYPDPNGGGGQRYWDGRAWQMAPPVSRQSRKSSPLKVLAIVGAAIFVLVVGCTALVEVIRGSHGTKSNTSSTAHQPSAQDLTPSNYQPISPRDYALLLKNPDAAKGRKLIVYGAVTQFDSATGNSDFRAETGAEPMERRYDYHQNTLVHAPDSAILTNVVEKDMVTMYVDVAGSYSYDTQIGGHTTAPLFNVYIIKVTNSGQ